MESKNLKKSERKLKQLNQAIDFVEELTWLLSSRRSIDLKAIPTLLREYIGSNSEINVVAGKFASPNPNKHFLIGILPRLFQDKALFPTNDDIAEFAKTVLTLNVTRQDKRSKYELIGMIVCETNDLNDEKLSDLVTALANIVGNEEKLSRIIEAKKEGHFSWNETIKKLAEQND